MLTRTQLLRDAIARTLFAPTTLSKAIDRLAFVQANPIRAPARAQDLILRHRVKDYRAGDLERRYASLTIEEDYLVNYGFLPREHVSVMQPRTSRRPWTTKHKTRAAAILEFIAERGEVHPQDVEEHFAHGRVRNAWGGMSRASTALLDLMHYGVAELGYVTGAAPKRRSPTRARGRTRTPANVLTDRKQSSKF